MIDPASWARRLLVGIIEASAGRRPLLQLTGLLTRAVSAGLERDLRVPQHRIRAAAVGTIRSCEPADGVAELSAVLRTPQRVHAAALRLEINHGHWVCTRLVIG